MELTDILNGFLL
jgi:hypothetical protein